jgi:hypothetical protein
MMYVSRFRPDTARSAEWLACLWQGPVPGDLELLGWLYVQITPPEMVLLWEGEAAARAWIERSFGSFGLLTTESVTSSTAGLQACLDRDLEAFGAWLRGRGTGEAEITRQLDVRRRGLEAESAEAAAQAGRDWAAGR